MKALKFIILIILFSKVSYSQKVFTYHYVLNEHIASVDSVPLLGMEQEFETTRKYFASSSFSETELFTGSDTKSINYKIDKGVWYYKSINKWKLFYDYNRMVGGYITLSKVRYKIKFIKVISIRNENLHKIILEPINISQSHKAQYYFSPTKGVLIIKNSSGIILLRKDSFEYSMTDDEFDVLYGSNLN
jgi:hypothetical protein